MSYPELGLRYLVQAQSVVESLRENPREMEEALKKAACSQVQYLAGAVSLTMSLHQFSEGRVPILKLGRALLGAIVATLPIIGPAVLTPQAPTRPFLQETPIPSYVELPPVEQIVPQIVESLVEPTEEIKTAQAWEQWRQGIGQILNLEGTAEINLGDGSSIVYALPKDLPGPAEALVNKLIEEDLQRVAKASGKALSADAYAIPRSVLEMPQGVDTSAVIRPLKISESLWESSQPIVGLIVKYLGSRGGDINWWVNKVAIESTFLPGAKSGDHRGLLQINYVVHDQLIKRELGLKPEDKFDPDILYDPEINIRIAAAVFDESKEKQGNGFFPWGGLIVFRTGPRVRQPAGPSFISRARAYWGLVKEQGEIFARKYDRAAEKPDEIQIEMARHLGDDLGDLLGTLAFWRKKTQVVIEVEAVRITEQEREGRIPYAVLRSLDPHRLEKNDQGEWQVKIRQPSEVEIRKFYLYWQNMTDYVAQSRERYKTEARDAKRRRQETGVEIPDNEFHRIDGQDALQTDSNQEVDRMIRQMDAEFAEVIHPEDMRTFIAEATKAVVNPSDRRILRAYYRQLKPGETRISEIDEIISRQPSQDVQETVTRNLKARTIPLLA